MFTARGYAGKGDQDFSKKTSFYVICKPIIAPAKTVSPSIDVALKKL